MIIFQKVRWKNFLSTGQNFTEINLQRSPNTLIIGNNGAGKSTLIKCIAGIYTPESGDYHFDGKPVTVSGPRDATALGIEVVYQDLALCDNLDIVHNMFLGREKKKGVTLDESHMELLARQTLDGTSATYNCRRRHGWICTSRTDRWSSQQRS